MHIKEINEEFERLSLNETYKNLFSEKEKQPYAQLVWDLIQATYKDIGGMKGKGFKDIQDMVETFPMWKLNVKDGKVVFVALYRDKYGRKACCAGNDGGRLGLLALKDFLKSELKTQRSWTEISGGVLKLCKKWFPELLEKSLISPQTIKSIDDEVEIVSDSSYTRPLANGERVEKSAYGKFNNPIK